MTRLPAVPIASSSERLLLVDDSMRERAVHCGAATGARLGNYHAVQVIMTMIAADSASSKKGSRLVDLQKSVCFLNFKNKNW